MKLPSVIIIGGVCGSGKSTVGKELAQRIGYAFVDADDFHTDENKTKMSRGESLSDAERMPWLNRVAELWSGENATKKCVVACSALKRKYRSFLLDEKVNKDKVIVMLIVSEKILKKRMAGRSDHFAKSNLIPSQLRDLEVPLENEGELRVMAVDGTHKVDDIINEIINKIKFQILQEQH